LLSQSTGVKLGVADPRRDTASLAAAMMVGEAVATDDALLPGLVKMFRGVVRADSEPDLLAGLGTQATGGPASAQEVTTLHARNSATPLAAVPFDPAGPRLDYPYAIRASVSRDLAAAAEQFLDTILGDAGVLVRAGFEAPVTDIGGLADAARVQR